LEQVKEESQLLLDDCDIVTGFGGTTIFDFMRLIMPVCWSLPDIGDSVAFCIMERVCLKEKVYKSSYPLLPESFSLKEVSAANVAIITQFGWEVLSPEEKQESLVLDYFSKEVHCNEWSQIEQLLTSPSALPLYEHIQLVDLLVISKLCRTLLDSTHIRKCIVGQFRMRFEKEVEVHFGITPINLRKLMRDERLAISGSSMSGILMYGKLFSRMAFSSKCPSSKEKEFLLEGKLLSISCCAF